MNRIEPYEIYRVMKLKTQGKMLYINDRIRYYLPNMQLHLKNLNNLIMLIQSA